MTSHVSRFLNCIYLYCLFLFKVSKIEACRCMMRCLEAVLNPGEDHLPSSLLSASFVEDGILSLPPSTSVVASTRQEVHLLMREGNFLDSVGDDWCDWETWDVVYMACTMFAEDQMDVLYQRVVRMPRGGYLILLDKQLPNTSDNDGITKITMDCFELIVSCQCKSSWGTTMAYVYYKFA